MRMRYQVVPKPDVKPKTPDSKPSTPSTKTLLHLIYTRTGLHAIRLRPCSSKHNSVNHLSAHQTVISVSRASLLIFTCWLYHPVVTHLWSVMRCEHSLCSAELNVNRCMHMYYKAITGPNYIYRQHCDWDSTEAHSDICHWATIRQILDMVLDIPYSILGVQYSSHPPEALSV